MREKWFVDWVKITVEGGKGGDGIIHFHREKYRPKGGPDGGDGGNGGNVYIVGVRGLKTLLDFKYKNYFKAEDGGNGGVNFKKGKKGRDLFIKVPLGTVIIDGATGEVIGEVLDEDRKILVAKGGEGGKGNARFATPTNQTPRIRELGKRGEKREIILELKLISEIGIIGFPNVGKSTLLKCLTQADVKIAPYPFTTITPNLGVLEWDESTVTLADIPGIVKDAHKGRGMGLSFLRHIERTLGLIFVIDASSSDPYDDYQVLLEELRMYNPQILQKPKIIVLNKIDLVGNKDALKLLLDKFSGRVFMVSLLRGDGVKELKEGIIEWWKNIKLSGTEQRKA